MLKAYPIPLAETTAKDMEITAPRPFAAKNPSLQGFDSLRCSGGASIGFYRRSDKIYS